MMMNSNAISRSTAAAALLTACATAWGCAADSGPADLAVDEARGSIEQPSYTSDTAGSCPLQPNVVARNYTLPTYNGAPSAGTCKDKCGNSYRIYRTVPFGSAQPTNYVSFQGTSEIVCSPPPPPPLPPPPPSACDANPYARCGNRLFHTDDYYDDLNPDVPGDDYQRRIHWVNHGIAEGRPSSITFHLDVYRAMYTDLAAFSGRQLLDHFDNFGVREGRSASLVFNPNVYRAFNPDLQNMSNEAAAKHYLNDGHKEGRQANLVFNPNAYRAYNPDLAGKSNYAVIVHYIRTGVHENRRASDQFDPAAYRAKNPDLARLSSRGLVVHYLARGAAEGRQAN